MIAWTPARTRLALAWLVLAAVALWSRQEEVWRSGVHGDEGVFVGAFAAFERGDSPYSAPLFNYPPPFAILGGELWVTLGERGFLLLLRHLELLGACVIGWIAVAATGWHLAVKTAVAAAIVAISVPIGSAIGGGNLAPLVQGAALAGLLLAPRRPLLAGLMIGAVCTIKPLPMAMIPLLLCYRAEPESGVRHWPQRTAVGAAASAGLLFALVGARYLPQMLARADIAAPSEHDLSLTRILRAFGFHLGAGFLFLAITAIAAIVLWRLRPDARGFNSVAATASVLALPIVWPHTLAITFPVQCQAVERGLRSVRGQVGWQRFVPALLLAAVLSIQGSSGGGAAPLDWPPAAKGLLAAIPIAALFGLCAYAVAKKPPAPPDQRMTSIHSESA